MRKLIFVTAMTVALAACGTDDDTANQNDLDAANATLSNMAMEDPAMNAAGGTTGNMDAANMANATDANTQNAMEKDMNTNDPDTNLANGM